MQFVRYYNKNTYLNLITDGEKFDFIIVGAGSVGSAVADRLSEDQKWKIILIEAGDDSPLESIVSTRILLKS